MLSLAVLRVPSSANKSHWTDARVRHRGKSLIKMQNRSGPRISREKRGERWFKGEGEGKREVERAREGERDGGGGDIAGGGGGLKGIREREADRQAERKKKGAGLGLERERGGGGGSQSYRHGIEVVQLVLSEGQEPFAQPADGAGVQRVQVLVQQSLPQGQLQSGLGSPP